MRSLSAKFVLAGALVSTGSVANAAVTYNVTAIPNVTGGTSATPYAVNDSGAVTGSARVGTATNAFVYTPSSGSSADIGTLAGTNTADERRLWHQRCGNRRWWFYHLDREPRRVHLQQRDAERHRERQQPQCFEHERLRHQRDR